MARPNVRQIEAFNAVMKGGSVTKAAETLFISQPAVSKLIQAFETSCGFPLFARTTGRLLPTPEARQLFVETQRLEIGVDRVRKTADAIRNLARGEISIASFPALGAQLLPRAVASFLHEMPEVQVSLLTGTSKSMEDDIITRAADMAFSLVRPENQALRSEVFCRVPMICILPANHALAAKEFIDLPDLADQPMIALGRDDRSSQMIEEALTTAGVSVRVVAEVQLSEAAAAMVSAGHGVSIASALTAAGNYDPNIVFRPLGNRLQATIWLITSAFEQRSALSIKIAEVINSAIVELDRRLFNAL